jgi:hypothetical protein
MPITRAARPLAAIAAVCAVATVSDTARAAPPGQTTPFPPVLLAPPTPVARAETPPPVTGYRRSLLAADLASAAVLGLGAALGSDAMVGAGTAGLFLAAPITHAAIGNPEHSALSFAARAGLPLLGLLAGAGIGDAGGSGSAAENVTGLAIGGALALGLDYGLLARRRDPSRATRAVAVTATTGGAVVGIAGRF